MRVSGLSPDSMFARSLMADQQTDSTGIPEDDRPQVDADDTSSFAAFARKTGYVT